ncbi:sugar MFS transporter [Clostridium sp. YIM B02551]|uniref:MFS transporter n=1 Tax=Clostridium sp. YIM B02551 TaxID=2910679 RepID=UPI001EEB6FB6|nr:MFS transporter [Clostridium sp. YIM B02551]
MDKGKNNWTALVFMFILMILAAFVENTKGIFIPTFKEQFSVGDTQIGNMLIITSGAYMVLTFLGGALCQKFGQKNVFIIGIILLIISLITLSKAQSFIILLFGMGLSSAGLALISIASNTILPIIVITAQTIIMNLMHFFYGFGSTLGQSLFGFLLSKGIQWRSIFLYIAITYGIILIAFVFVKIPKPKIAHGEDKLSFKDVITNKLILAYMLALGFYVFAEQGTGNWFVNYLIKAKGFTQENAALYLSLFFGTLTIGRLLGGFVVHKLGYFKVLITSLTIGVILYVLGLIIGGKGILIVSFAGMFFAITFPTIVLTVSKVFTQRTAYITGLVVTASNFMAMIFNWITGYINDKINPDNAIFIIPICGALSVISMLYINKNTKSILKHP